MAGRIELDPITLNRLGDREICQRNLEKSEAYHKFIAPINEAVRLLLKLTFCRREHLEMLLQEEVPLTNKLRLQVRARLQQLEDGIVQEARLDDVIFKGLTDPAIQRVQEKTNAFLSVRLTFDKSELISENAPEPEKPVFSLKPEEVRRITDDIMAGISTGRESLPSRPSQRRGRVTQPGLGIGQSPASNHRRTGYLPKKEGDTNVLMPL